MKKYAVGVDFGTLSGRCVLVDVQTGEEAAVSTLAYRHAVMSERLPDGTPLELDWALQHPKDYIEVLEETIPAVLREAHVSPEQVVGIGIDITAYTLLPIKKDGTPLCFLEQYKSNPHAYVKLWKHHAAQDEANRLNQTARERGETFLKRYGGKISSEWAFPKIWQVLNEAPEIYEEADYFVEAADWIVFQLCGNLLRNSVAAGCKAIWDKNEGFPSKEFFAALDPRLENVIEDKMNNPIVQKGKKAGEITPHGAKITGLKEGTAVAAADLDATWALIGAGLTRPGQMLILMGTSNCHMLIGEGDKEVPGMCGVVQDSMIPGYAGYEAGQSCVGDHFQWFVENCVPEDYAKAAREKGMNLHQYLTEKARRKLPGETGLVALDWWNGNRCVLVDGQLSGVMLGCTLQTKPEDMYRALIEATAFGTRKIIETYQAYEVPVDEIHVTGGIAIKNPFIMQIYADVVKMPITTADSPQIPALSSAIWGALAAGEAAGGYDQLEEAVQKMSKGNGAHYEPIPENSAVYDKLYQEYERLHDYFGRGDNDVMKRLKDIAGKQRRKNEVEE